MKRKTKRFRFSTTSPCNGYEAFYKLKYTCGITNKMPTPTNDELYNTVVKEAKKRFKVWPSAYASGWVTKTYVSRGGTYVEPKSSTPTGIDRWFKEQWIDVCQLPELVPCGRHSASLEEGDAYPYCRPLHRVSQQTPKTVDELTPSELSKRCSKKQKIKHTGRITK